MYTSKLNPSVLSLEPKQGFQKLLALSFPFPSHTIIKKEKLETPVPVVYISFDLEAEIPSANRFNVLAAMHAVSEDIFVYFRAAFEDYKYLFNHEFVFAERPTISYYLVPPVYWKLGTKIVYAYDHLRQIMFVVRTDTSPVVVRLSHVVIPLSLFFDWGPFFVYDSLAKQFEELVEHIQPAEPEDLIVQVVGFWPTKIERNISMQLEGQPYIPTKF